MQVEKIELQKPHTHGGTLLEPGDVIDLPSDLARWLVEAGIAKPYKAIPATKPQPKSEDNL